MITVTAAIIEKDGLVLAARRKPGNHLAGYWEFPGGKLEEGEAPEACLKRELAEEFQVDVEIGSLLGESVYDYGDKVIRLLAYRVVHKVGDFQLMDHDQLCWLKPEVLSQLEWAPADIPLVKQYQSQRGTDSYYLEPAKLFVAETRSLDLSGFYQTFLSLVPEGGRTLDLGCGSGRDSKAFIEEGYRVTAMDASPEMVQLAVAEIGQPVILNTFQEADYHITCDGIWDGYSHSRGKEQRWVYGVVRKGNTGFEGETGK